TRLLAGHRFDSQAVLDRLSGQWEYQLSCSYEFEDKPFNKPDHDYLNAHLTRNAGWRWGDGETAFSQAYRFGDAGKQLCVAILEPEDILSWRLRAESLDQLASLVKLISHWPRVLENLMPDSYADSYQETLDLIEGLRSQGSGQRASD